MVTEFFRRIRYWNTCDRLGPDIPTTHWRLYFRSTMRRLCQSKFRHFDATADFRPGAYAMGCSIISIGRRVVIRPLSVLHADDSGSQDAPIVIEDDVLMGTGVHIYTNNHAYHDTTIPIYDQGYIDVKGVTIKRGSWIGANVVIMPGVIIGENSVVGAGSIVTQDVPDRVIAAGSPAKVIRTL